MIIEQSETLLKRNVYHVKRFIDSEPRASQSKQELTQPPEQTPVMEPVVLTNPQPLLAQQNDLRLSLHITLLLTQTCHSLLLISPVARELSLVGLIKDYVT